MCAILVLHARTRECVASVFACVPSYRNTFGPFVCLHQFIGTYQPTNQPTNEWDVYDAVLVDTFRSHCHTIPRILRAIRSHCQTNGTCLCLPACLRACVPACLQITHGVQHYFRAAVDACVEAWPDLAHNGLLATHAGACGDPLLIQWDSAMAAPATPGYSFYLRPPQFDNWTQPGLKAALDAYDPGVPGVPRGQFVVAESACFGCKTAEEWAAYFTAVFQNAAGDVRETHRINQ